ncbi:MAG: DAK2 domain-containing protein [Bacillota bacterium]|nr:DAK2 domain-containing protein [Bacillota bacterium]NLD11866.1 DAK2 domain-containing protein [Bacillota bacterium]HPU60811.1 DAK2 domain-containing protein [Bacillota bacterium]
MGRTLLDAEDFARAISAGTEWLGANKELVNSLNVFPVPDGDTGTNMHLTLLAAVREISKVQGKTLSDIAEAVALGSLMGARGNSGVILSQLLRGFAKGVEGKTTLDVAGLARGLQVAASMAYKAVMKPVEGTMLTVARQAARSAVECKRNNLDMVQAVEKILNDAQDTLEKTPEMLPTLKEAGVVDAGGQGLVFFWEGFVKSIRGEAVFARRDALVAVPQKADSKVAARKAKEEEKRPDLEFRYCTEFLVKGKNLPLDMLRQNLTRFGDCVLVVGTDDVAKVHVHTNHPGQVLEHCIRLGELHEIKIDNMAYQHNEFEEAKSKRDRVVSIDSGDDEQDSRYKSGGAGEAKPKEQKVEKPVGVVAVAVGEGLSEILKSLGADVIVEGGQTMNPSIEELRDAVYQVAAKSVIILPNNGNVILTADKVKEIVSDIETVVIPTKTIPQGVAALVTYNPSVDAESNRRSMEDMISQVSTGEVTYAVRASSVNGFSIDEKDFIGIKDGELCSTGKDRNEVAMSLVSQMVDSDTSLITIYHGKDIRSEDANELAERLADVYPYLEIEVHYGGQPVYYYIISAE